MGSAQQPLPHPPGPLSRATATTTATATRTTARPNGVLPRRARFSLFPPAFALVLALIGGWIASWLNTRSRLTSFAVLRAVGTTPRQILSVLLWEYGIVYLTALALGFLFGWLLSSAALPSLVFADALDNACNIGPVFDVPPTRLVVP